MDRSTQISRAQQFRKLHQGPKVLVLPNAWDVVTAKLYEVEGFGAVATTSAGISSTLGFADGERMSVDENLAVCRRIIEHVVVPVSVDMEAGYGSCLDSIAQTVSKVIEAGAVGINLEDSAKAGCGGSDAGGLLDIAVQAERITAARKVADQSGVPLVINARTDVFLAEGAPSPRRLAEAIERGRAYRRAGADCVFVPDMGELREQDIAALVEGIDAPVNLVAGENTPSVKRLEALRVARLSFGPRPMRAALQFVREMAREWAAKGTYTLMARGSALSYDEVNGWFSAGDCDCDSTGSACKECP